MKDKIKQYLDEDYLWKKFQSKDKYGQDEFQHFFFSVTSVAEDFVKQGKLSMIMANRIRRGGYRFCSRLKEKPSEWRKRVKWGDDLIDLQLFKNAFKKFAELSMKENHKQLKKKLKFWEDVRLKSVLY